MHFLAQQGFLLENLNIVERAIPVRSPLQVIKGILVEAKDNTLSFTANNLEIAVRAECLDVEILEEGVVVLPGKLVDIVRQLPSEKLEIKTDEEGLRMEIFSGHTKFFLYGMNADEFPVISAEEEWKNWGKLVFTSADLKNIIKKVIFAASQDESKPLFRGVLIEVDSEENVTCMASDTYRLAHNNILTGKKHHIQPLRMLIPSKSLFEIMRILDDSREKVELYYLDHEMIIKYRQFIFSGRLLEDKYPNFTDAFPAASSTKIVVNTGLLEKTLGRAALLAQGPNQMISLSIQDKNMQIRSGSEIGRMSEELSLLKKEGSDLEEILLNCRYFSDPLRVVDEEYVEIEFNGPFGPCIFNCHRKQDDLQEIYRYLVLPIKVDKKEN